MKNSAGRIGEVINATPVVRHPEFISGSYWNLDAETSSAGRSRLEK